MMIIGVDYHPSFQTIAFLMEETGECGEQELHHSDGQAEKFYRDLKQRGICVRVGMEATGYSRWFERLLAELGFELWIGDPAEIKAKRVKKQKTDRNDARLLRRLMLENNFPQIWVPSPENRDLRQLLWHRHRLVQMRTRIMNQLQACEHFQYGEADTIVTRAVDRAGGAIQVFNCFVARRNESLFSHAPTKNDRPRRIGRANRIGSGASPSVREGWSKKQRGEQEHPLHD